MHRLSLQLSFLTNNGNSSDLLLPDSPRAAQLYQHIFIIPKPTLAFVGMPKMAALFLVAQAQSAVIARAFSGRITVPSEADMRQWKSDKIAAWRLKVKAGEALGLDSILSSSQKIKSTSTCYMTGPQGRILLQ